MKLLSVLFLALKIALILLLGLAGVSCNEQAVSASSSPLNKQYEVETVAEDLYEIRQQALVDSIEVDLLCKFIIKQNLRTDFPGRLLLQGRSYGFLLELAKYEFLEKNLSGPAATPPAPPLASSIIFSLNLLVISQYY